MIGTSVCVDGVKEVVSNTIARGVLIGIDHQLRELGVGYPTFKRDVERVAMGICAGVLFDINSTDPKRLGRNRVGVKDNAWFEFFKSATSQPADHRIRSLALESSYCADTGWTNRP